MSRGTEEENQKKAIRKGAGKMAGGEGIKREQRDDRLGPDPIEHHITCTWSKDPNKRRTAGLERNANLSRVHLLEMHFKTRVG